MATCKMPNKSASLKSEHRFKKLSRQQKLDAIQNGIESLFPEYLNANQNDGNSNRDHRLRTERCLMKENPS